MPDKVFFGLYLENGKPTHLSEYFVCIDGDNDAYISLSNIE